MNIPSNKFFFGKATHSLSLSGFRLAILRHILITLLILLLPPIVFAQNEADRLDNRAYSDDYRSRKRRMHREEEIEKRKEEIRKLEERDSLDRAENDKNDDDRKDDSNGKDPTVPGQDKNSDDMGPYGSQFKTPSFVDDDFSKHTFTDLILQNGPRAGDKEFSPSAQADLTTRQNKEKEDRYGDKDHVAMDADKEKAEKHGDPREDMDEEYEPRFDAIQVLLKPPIDAGPKNWAPSEIDDTNNGGFGTISDNGSPVPYRLNGHVDIQRERPYRESDSD